MLKLPNMRDSQSAKLAVGDKAPDFTLPDQSKRPVKLADLLGKGPIVLFFYPKDFSAGCTAEVCAFRDNYEAFTDAGATVIGVSADSTESHDGFVQKHSLPFILLSDPDSAVHNRYGVEKSFGIVRGRVTYIIDAQGIVQHIFSSQMNINKHITDALQVVKELK